MAWCCTASSSSTGISTAAGSSSSIAYQFLTLSLHLLLPPPQAFARSPPPGIMKSYTFAVVALLLVAGASGELYWCLYWW
jgi:hypothetical protein